MNQQDNRPDPDEIPSVYQRYSVFDLDRIEIPEQVAVTYAYTLELTEPGAGMGIDYVQLHKSALGDGEPVKDDPLLYLRLLRNRLAAFLSRVENIRGRRAVEMWARYHVEDVSLEDLGAEYDRDASSVWRSNRLTRELIEDWIEKGKL